jgi:hypothetical protein
MSLTAMLSSSSFFLADNIERLIKNNQATESQINYAGKLGLLSALKYRQESTVFGSGQWLQYTTQLAKTDNKAAVELTDFYHSQGELDTALFWAKRAVKLDSTPARIYLGKHYFSQKKYQQAIDVLFPISKQQESLLLLIEIAIIQGDYEFISSHIEFLNNFVAGQNLYALIHKYKIIAPLVTTMEYTKREPLQQCIANVQMFATTLKNLQKVDKLIVDFNVHPLSSYFCFNTVRYIPEKELTCGHDKNKAIQCNESMWSDINQNRNTRYLGLMVPEGGANVNAGIMYLDSNDNVQVFAHELSHLLGFVDEYALAKDHQQCRENQSQLFAHNISVISTFYQGSRKEARAELLKKLSWAKQIEPTTPILQATTNGWLAGTPDSFNKDSRGDDTRSFNNKLGKKTIGLYTSDTCNFNNTTAFKPVKGFTQLSYYEIEFPHEYISILNEDNKKHLMPIFHYNVAIHLLNNGLENFAFIWLNKALSREVEDTPRYERIKRGVF